MNLNMDFLLCISVFDIFGVDSKEIYNEFGVGFCLIEG